MTSSETNPRRRDGRLVACLICLVAEVFFLGIILLAFGDAFQAADNVALVILFVFAGILAMNMSHLAAHIVRVRKRRGRRPGAVTRWLPLAVLALPALLFLPAQVDAAAYLADAGPTATFLPLVNGPSSETTGILTTGHASVTAIWPAKVPLFRPFALHPPVWAWGTGHGIITSTATAIVETLGCLFLNVIALPLILWIARAVILAVAPGPARNIWDDIY
jgi:hypothetical protein